MEALSLRLVVPSIRVALRCFLQAMKRREIAR